MLQHIIVKFTMGKLKSSYEADFIQGLLKNNKNKLARSFNFTFRYIDDVLSLNNSRFDDFVGVVNQKLEYVFMRKS
jgi:hypothetical protein